MYSALQNSKDWAWRKGEDPWLNNIGSSYLQKFDLEYRVPSIFVRGGGIHFFIDQEAAMQEIERFKEMQEKATGS